MLRGHGHIYAGEYPLGMVYDEVNMTTERENNRMVVEAELIRSAVNGMLAKGARGQFSKLTKQLNVSTRLRPGLLDDDETVWGGEARLEEPIWPDLPEGKEG